METTIQNIVQIKKRLDLLTKRIAKANFEFNNLTKTLKEVCPHEKFTKQSKYYEGGYLNTDYTEYKHVCDYCGKILKEWSVNHGSYA